MGNFKVTTAPASEPVTATEVKAALNIETTDDDDLLADYITEARQWVEQQCGSALITQTVTEKFDLFGEMLMLTVNPVQSVTSVKYYDEDGTQQTLAASKYDVDVYSVPCRIAESTNNSWPSVQDRIAPIEVIYVAGYGDDAADVPGPIKRAIHLYVGSLYAQREDVVNRYRTRARALLENYDFSSW